MPPDPRADAARFVRIGRTVCEDARQHIERTSLMVQWSKEAARTSQHRLAVSWDMLVRARSSAENATSSADALQQSDAKLWCG